MNKTLAKQAAKLLRDAIDCPFTTDERAWNRWCLKWRWQAQDAIEKLEKYDTITDRNNPRHRR